MNYLVINVNPGYVYGANSIPVNLEKIQRNLMSDRLDGKPKILIIQASITDETQRNMQVLVEPKNIY